MSRHRRSRNTRTTFGPWRVGGYIGKGGQSIVYKAFRQDQEQEVFALKRLVNKGAKACARFANEVHKHVELVEKGAQYIMPVHDHNLDQFAAGRASTGYIVMPLAIGNLQNRIGTFTMRVELCLEVFRKIVLGIREAHQAGVVHRDLKPANILFLDESLKRPLLSDFGICFVRGTPKEERLTGVNETVGARFYMAPEQEMGGQVDVTESVDLYALGKVLHYMLTGRHLQREDLDDAITPKEIQSDPRLRTVLERILRRTIVRDPTQRVQSADDLLAAINEVSDSPIGSPPIPQTNPIGTNGRNGNLPVPEELSSRTKLRDSYENACSLLEIGNRIAIKVAFDHCRGDFRATWDALLAEVEGSPDQAKKAASRLIRGQLKSIGVAIAIVRLDADQSLGDAKALIEFILRIPERKPGFAAIQSIPHTLAGFMYMTSVLSALHFHSWRALRFLLRTKFESYRRSTMPAFDFGFEVHDFFHSETLSNEATAHHDLYRQELQQPPLLEILGVDPEELMNVYCQAQMLMCLRAAQEVESEKLVHIFADFGRFYDFRVLPLIKRIENDSDYASGICSGFEETRHQWLAAMPGRVKIIRNEFWGGTRHIWNSIGR